jgi:hypothetical protein
MIVLWREPRNGAVDLKPDPRGHLDRAFYKALFGSPLYQARERCVSYFAFGNILAFDGSVNRLSVKFRLISTESEYISKIFSPFRWRCMT